MIDRNNLESVLLYYGFTNQNNVYTREYSSGAIIKVDFNQHKIEYAPKDNRFSESEEFPTLNNQASGFVIHRGTTLNFSQDENYVCLICIHLLLEKGYLPKHIVIEPAFRVGHNTKPSYGDVLVFDNEYKPLVLIENKRYGSDFSKEWNKMEKNGGQLFSYLGPLVNQLGMCKNLVLFSADFEEKEILKSHVITLEDNDKRLAELDNPKTFRDVQGKYFEVWSETYSKSFETKGLFEKDIAAYSIGKLNYTIRDLKELSHAEIKPIYHEFATILRNHAITDFEHSFYILIDLFLCKITDERNYPNDLQFYYRGITRDTPKEYCRRLLDLYQLGKKQLFDVQVVNKNENDIKRIFEDTNRSLRNGLFEGIKTLFDEIKFYNIKKFNFIEVENKEDFELNFQILIKIVSLIQDINLSSSETNHFFGDLFEGLLSKNVHQTEGQFFTPLPIVNFIIRALPKFENISDFKVLDYACGAGHFLTEYTKNYPKTKIYGIEKNQPLSHVAKIATIINGAKECHVVFKDTLSYFNTRETRYSGFDNEDFDLIIANPPYSVKGFLSTLSANERNQFKLMDDIDEQAIETNKNIECFFVERSKQFLKQDGFMAIILPSSVLSSGKLYVKTRDILFANFNILAVVTLGSRTFGSTGTNTIILFAQKTRKNAEGLLNAFIEKQDYTQYTTYGAIDSYIAKQGYDKVEYSQFMQDGILNEELSGTSVFKDYHEKFIPEPISNTLKTEWYNASSFFEENVGVGSKKYNKLFNAFLNSEQYAEKEAREIRKQFISFSQDIEKNKLKTFIQIADNFVAVLNSPPDKKNGKQNKNEIIKFLGYDWSKRKGSEGIKYKTNSAFLDSIENNNEEENDSDAINQINSIKYIDTMLYNPEDEWDTSKFSFVIRKHISTCCKHPFEDEHLQLNSTVERQEFFSCINLADCIDFSNADFDKQIKLSSNSEEIVEIDSIYEEKKIKEIVTSIEAGSRPEGGATDSGVLSLGGEHIDNVSGFLKLDNLKYVPEGFYNRARKGKLKKYDLLVCKDGALTGKVALVRDELANQKAMINEHVFLIRCANLVTQKYLFEFFYSIGEALLKSNVTGAAQGGLTKKNLEKIMIPLPPIDIQLRIVDECEVTNDKDSKIEIFKRLLK